MPNGNDQNGAPPPVYDTSSTGYQNMLDSFTGFQSAYGAMVDEGTAAREEPGAGGLAGRRALPEVDAAIFSQYQPQFDEMAGLLSQYGIRFEWTPGTGREATFWLPGTGGHADLQTTSFEDVIGYFTGQVETTAGQEQRQQEFDTFTDSFTGWMTDFQAGIVTVDPFADENGWAEMVKGIVGDLGGMPDMQELLMSFHDIMPVWDYTADALPNLTGPERMAKFFDDLAAKGFTMTEPEQGLDQEMRDFLYRQAQELSPKNMFQQLNLDRTSWDAMTNVQIAELMKVIGRKSVLSDTEQQKYVDMKMRTIRHVNRDEYNRILAGLAARGAGQGAAVIRSAQDLTTRLVDAEMNVTADIFLKGIELAEQQKPAAMQTWAGINDTHAELILNIGKLKTTLFGQYFDYVLGAARVSAAEYATTTERYIAQSTLQLKYDLGMAGLDVEKYISDRGLDIEELELEYDNYWKDRGSSLEEHRAEFDSAITKWQTSSMMTEMINSGRTDRLVQMAALALKAQSGDREAWESYQGLALQEQLQQRGMDNDQAMALADLMQERYTFGENMDFQRWAIKHNALLKKELLRMGIEGERELMEYEDELAFNGFWASVLNVAGGAAKLGAAIYGGGDSEAVVPPPPQ